MELQTKRLKIIPCTYDSLSIYETEGYEISPHINMYLEELKEDSSLSGWGVWLVINKHNNTILGDIGFKGKPNSDNTVEVGYGILPKAQKKGYATEAVNALIKWAFSFDNVNKIIAECLMDNIPSIRVLEKLNMNRIGTKDGLILWQLSKEI